MILKHYGKVISGKRIYYNVELHREAIFNLEGQEFEEVIKLKHKKVSEDAFAYYYAGVIGTALEYEMFGGWNKDDIDEFFSDMFLTYTKTLCLKEDNGTETFRTIKKVESKGQGFSSKKMWEFTEKCIVWLSENGIYVAPSENYVLGKYKTVNVQS